MNLFVALEFSVCCRPDAKTKARGRLSVCVEEEEEEEDGGGDDDAVTCSC